MLKRLCTAKHDVIITTTDVSLSHREISLVNVL